MTSKPEAGQVSTEYLLITMGLIVGIAAIGFVFGGDFFKQLSSALSQQLNLELILLRLPL